jgi:hypothetical protein
LSREKKEKRKTAVRFARGQQKCFSGTGYSASPVSIGNDVLGSQISESPLQGRESAWNYPNIMEVFGVLKTESILPNVDPTKKRGNVSI